MKICVFTNYGRLVNHWGLFLFCAFFSNECFSQSALDKRIDIDLNQVPFKTALEAISQKTGVHFLYSDKMISSSAKVNVNSKNETLKQLLDDLFSENKLNYQVDELQVIIRNQRVDRIVKGRVVNGRSKEPLIGVTIKVKGTAIATVSDVNGNFSIAVPEGKEVLIVSYIGFATKEVKASSLTSLNILLDESSRIINEVVVQARRRANNEVAVLKERQNSSVVSDAISARQIEKTASITTAQALQRVTGVTITDDKYVAIRGLGDRSVVAELNGIRLSSANPDRSAVPLDLVPAALLENVTVYKTLTPDKPADASAGIIELKTKSIPDSLTVSFTAESGFNSSVGLSGQYNAFLGSDLGYFGQRVSDRNLSPDFLKLRSQYPGGLQQIQFTINESRYSNTLTNEVYRINRIMHSFSPVLTTSYQRAVPNQIYSANFGDVYHLSKRPGGPELGIIISGNYYHRTEDRYNAELNQYFPYTGIVTGNQSVFKTLFIPISTTPNSVNLNRYLSYKESSGIETLNYGVLGGLSLRINKLNEIGFQYLGSRGAEAQGSNLTGSYGATRLRYPVYNQVNVLSQSYRVFNNLNFQGEHKFFNRPYAPQLSYNIGISKSSQNQPDNRVTEIADAHQLTNLDVNGVSFGKDYYTFITGQTHYKGFVYAIDPNGRFYRTLTENNNNFKIDLTEPFKVLGNRQEIKIGFNYLKRDRSYAESILGIPGSPIGGGDTSLINKFKGDVNQLVSFQTTGILQDPVYYQQVGAPRIGGYLYQIGKTPNNYKGFYQTKAFYAMIDARFAKHFRVIGGVRFESTFIKATVDTSGVLYPPTPYFGSPPNKITHPVSALSVKLSPYYSVNLVYSSKHNMNFRLAYNTALARPELRELTQIFTYDPFQFAVIGGNSSLVNQLTRSLDFRWEWFPNAGEVFAVSAFGKKIYNQLTKTYQFTSQGTYTNAPEFPVVVFENDPSVGKVYGIELEARKNLGNVWSGLRHLNIGSNFLLAASEILKNPQRLSASRTIDRSTPASSPVFEQAPYSINVYLDYDNYKTGSTATLSFNEVGERLVQVNLDGTPDLYDRPVPLLDFVFSQKLGRRFQLKGFAKNILNHAYETVYTIPGNQGTYRGNHYVNHRYFRGSEFLLGMTFNLF